GLLYVGLALVTDSVYVLLTSRLRRLFTGRLTAGRLPQVASGVVYIRLGLSTAPPADEPGAEDDFIEDRLR
ncbi:MAG: hypothetical protein VYB08_11800, partial [Candidatus Latescibacterota bacterium]|nr:hypothetical protein [Candidatus Latescibacterota bacterium]